MDELTFQRKMQELLNRIKEMPGDNRSATEQWVRLDRGRRREVFPPVRTTPARIDIRVPDVPDGRSPAHW